jgi:undecaprenyl-diphosphatase
MLDAILGWDETARAWLAGYHTPVLDAVMVGLSRAGRGGMLWLALGIVIVLARRRMAAGVLQMALAIALTSLLADAVVKPVVGRLRPSETLADVRVLEPRHTSGSFPSGHAANAFAAAYALARLVPTARMAIWLLAVAVSFSRIYVGVHYPLDVGAGALIGLACSVFVVGGSRWYSVDSAARTPPVPR